METRESLIILADLLEVNKESSAQIALLVEEVKQLRSIIKEVVYGGQAINVKGESNAQTT